MERKEGQSIRTGLLARCELLVQFLVQRRGQYLKKAKVSRMFANSGKNRFLRGDSVILVLLS